MSHKLDCTEKAYEIMMKHTTWRKPKRMTPKRKKAKKEKIRVDKAIICDYIGFMK